MGKVMSKEKDARDVALREYNTFMEKYKAGVEGGNPKLMQHMLKLEANKIRTQDILNSIEKSQAGLDEGLYDFEKDKMKLQMNSEEYRKDQAREEAFIQMATKDTTQEEKEEPKQASISIGDPDKMDAYRLDLDVNDFGQIAPVTPAPKKEVKKEVKKEPKPVSSAIEVDPKTGKKVYKGPKLRSRKIVDGKVWDSSHPNFHDRGVGGM